MQVLCQFTHLVFAGFSASDTVLDEEGRSLRRVWNSTMLQVMEPTDILPEFDRYVRRSRFKGVVFVAYIPENLKATW